ncbi:V4R domain-containing protein [Methanosarcina sp. KYL-1]|uniref:V4R domain-containing protein n=1 Tax=Methanosarcina sp. KYL-1 TaxID=2602068 RepID=UPI002100C640
MDSPVKLQILDLLREEPRSFDEIVKYTSKAKSTVSVHLNNLRSCELVEERVDPEDRRRKIYSLTSYYMGCSQKPVFEHYNSLLEKVAGNGMVDRSYFMEALFHTLRFGFEAYGIDNAPVVKMIGNDVGRRLAPTFEARAPEELLKEIGVFLESHWKCRVSVSGTEPVSFRVENPFKAESLPVIGKPFCAFNEGLIEGILREKLGQEYRVRETECYGTGHGHCLFEITL